MPNLEAVETATHRPDTWSAHNSHCLAQYRILAEAEPDLLCRVLNLFAMQYLIPQQVNVQQAEDMLMIDVQIDRLSWHRAQVIGEKMRNLINVCTVELEQLGHSHVSIQSVSLAAS